jgi:hypothetical protein
MLLKEILDVARQLIIEKFPLAKDELANLAN